MVLLLGIELVFRFCKIVIHVSIMSILSILLLFLDINIFLVEVLTRFRQPISDRVALLSVVIQFGLLTASLMYLDMGGLMMMSSDWSERIFHFITQKQTINEYTVCITVEFNLLALHQALFILLYNLLIVCFLLVSCSLAYCVSHPVFISVGFFIVYSRFFL